MNRLRIGVSLWIAGVPLVAQSQPGAGTPLAERVAAFVASPSAVVQPDYECQTIAAEISNSSLDAKAKLALLEQLQTSASSLTQETVAYVALAVVGEAVRLGDHERSIREARVAIAAPGDGSLASLLRERGLKLLFQQALRIGDVASAFPYLDRYAEVADPCEAGLAEVDLLLHVGMIKAAATALDRLETLEATALQEQRVAVLRLQENLANEQFEAARSGAQRLLRTEGLPIVRVHQARLTEAFAMVRMGEVVEAMGRLRALIAEPNLGREHASLVRAELAMLRLQGGESPASASEELAPDLGVPIADLPDWSLAARARLVLAMVRGAGDRAALSAVHAELLRRHAFSLRQWRATPVLSSGVAFLQWSVRRELLVCLCECEVALGHGNAAMACLRHLLESDACGSLAREMGMAAAEPESLIQRVRPKDGLLAWFVPAPRGSLVVLVDGEGVRLVTLPSDMSLRGLVRKLRLAVRHESVLGAKWREPLAALGAPLADWLDQPELRAALSRSQRIRIIGRELLTGLPFEFLSSPVQEGQWFGHTHAIDYVPSATLATAPRPDLAPRRQARVTLLAAGTQSREASERYPGCVVPIAASQLAKIAAAVDPAVVEVAVDVDREKLLAVLPDTDVLVVLAHGQRRHRDDVVDERQRHRPLGIVLGDGFFGPERLHGLARVPSVVVLASCGTARSGVDRGEDGQLFGTAWLAAGASLVLSAEGDLELQATAQLVQAFLAGLARNMAPAEALQQARIEVAAVPSLEHPALHCALRIDVAGESMGLRLPAAPQPLRWVVWASLACLVALAMVGRRLRKALRTESPSPRC